MATGRTTPWATPSGRPSGGSRPSSSTCGRCPTARWRTPSPPFNYNKAFIISILCLSCGGVVPHMVPMSLRQIKNRIPLDLARLQATNEPCYVGSEHCRVLQCGAAVLTIARRAHEGETGSPRAALRAGDRDPVRCEKAAEASQPARIPILLLCAISPAPRRQSGSAHRAAPGRYADLRSLSRSLLLRSQSSRHRSRTASCPGRSSPSASSP